MGAFAGLGSISGSNNGEKGAGGPVMASGNLAGSRNVCGGIVRGTRDYHGPHLYILIVKLVRAEDF